MMTSILLSIIFLLPHLTLGALPRLGGINIGGMEWGIVTDGSRANNFVAPPISQVTKFINDGSNLIRLPLGWQFSQASLNGPLNTAYMDMYDKYLTTATSAGAYVIIDVHNYARYNKNIVGESARLPATALVDLWTKLAIRYKSNPRVMFGLMNEPHDQAMATWAKVVQAVVTGIRKAGATNPILIPGNDYTSMSTFGKWYYEGLNNVKNPDGTFNNLFFEFHRYLDSDGSGTHPVCVSDRVAELKAAVAILQKDKRQAILGETGGGPTAACLQMIPSLLANVKSAYPTFIGFAMWGAGSYKAGDGISLVPAGNTNAPIWNAAKPFLPGRAKRSTRRSRSDASQ